VSEDEPPHPVNNPAVSTPHASMAKTLLFVITKFLLKIVFVFLSFSCLQDQS
jgi:hypothetical protein